MNTTIIIGSTGLVGSFLLDHLLESPQYESVRSLVRRPTQRVHEKLTESVVNFDDLDASRDIVKGDDVFCAIGTTMKTAGSREAFKKVDYDYAVNTAGIALANGASRFFLVSSIGAHIASKVFYSKLKGELEQTISKMPYQSVSIFRPAMILGERTEKRPIADTASNVLKVTSFAMLGPFRRYRPIHAETIARAMVRVAEREDPGVHVYESDRIAQLGRS